MAWINHRYVKIFWLSVALAALTDRARTHCIKGDPLSWTMGSVVSYMLIVTLIVFCVRKIPAFLQFLRDLPMPRSAVVILTIIVGVQLIHTVLRLEHYPFPQMAMFSGPVKPPDQAESTYSKGRYVLLKEDGGAEVVSMLMEGKSFFAQYTSSLDYKMGWLFTMYRRGLYPYLVDHRWQGGTPRPIYTIIEYTYKDGQILRMGGDSSWLDDKRQIIERVLPMTDVRNQRE